MCGIAGMSMSPTSTVNTRSLAHSLLAGIQSRGSDSSGFGFTKGNTLDAFKRAVPGSELPLGLLPRRAEAVILHTRFATQGSKHDMRNNHPVISPDGTIALVHNGVISNDFDWRYGPDAVPGLAAVDTAVIPYLLQDNDLRNVAPQLEGYAAISWLDQRDEDSRLHLARLDHSPVYYTWLLDGSFVFASTQSILAAALADNNLKHGHIFAMPEEEYFQIVGGVIMHHEDGIKMQVSSWALSRFGSATAGGHGASTPKAQSSSPFDNGDWDDELDGEFTKNADGTWSWRSAQLKARACSTDPDEISMALAGLERESNDADADTDTVVAYYYEHVDGTLEIFQDLEDLERGLDELTQLDYTDKVPVPGAPKRLRWVNFVADLGHIGSKSNQNSWLEDMRGLDMHKSPGVFNLNYIREGISDMIQAGSI